MQVHWALFDSMRTNNAIQNTVNNTIGLSGLDIHSKVTALRYIIEDAANSA